MPTPQKPTPAKPPVKAVDLIEQVDAKNLRCDGEAHEADKSISNMLIKKTDEESLEILKQVQAKLRTHNIGTPDVTTQIEDIGGFGHSALSLPQKQALIKKEVRDACLAR